MNKEQQEQLKDLAKRLEMAGKHAAELNSKIQQQAGIINNLQQQNEYLIRENSNLRK